ncbi:MAG: hypothetical protein ACF8QF_00605 [Phycisphaerales bacterium]
MGADNEAVLDRAHLTGGVTALVTPIAALLWLVIALPGGNLPLIVAALVLLIGAAIAGRCVRVLWRGGRRTGALQLLCWSLVCFGLFAAVVVTPLARLAGAG